MSWTVHSSLSLWRIWLQAPDIEASWEKKVKKIQKKKISPNNFLRKVGSVTGNRRLEVTCIQLSTLMGYWKVKTGLELSLALKAVKETAKSLYYHKRIWKKKKKNFEFTRYSLRLEGEKGEDNLTRWPEAEMATVRRHSQCEIPDNGWVQQNDLHT